MSLPGLKAFYPDVNEGDKHQKQVRQRQQHLQQQHLQQQQQQLQQLLQPAADPQEGPIDRMQMQLRPRRRKLKLT